MRRAGLGTALELLSRAPLHCHLDLSAVGGDRPDEPAVTGEAPVLGLALQLPAGLARNAPGLPLFGPQFSFAELRRCRPDHLLVPELAGSLGRQRQPSAGEFHLPDAAGRMGPHLTNSSAYT
jgi:hypothetical protein